MRLSKQKQQGFTLIELVVVIVILGILAAFAVPRFIDINTDARRAAVEGLAGSMRSAAALLHGLSLARSTSAGPPATLRLEGVDITMLNGYPTADAAGIGATMTTLAGFGAPVTTAGPPATISYVPASLVNTTITCTVTYTAALAGGAASVATATGNCS